jgi:hypothetical protein
MDMACLGHPWNRSGNGFGHPVFVKKTIYGIKPSTRIENLDSPMPGARQPAIFVANCNQRKSYQICLAIYLITT